MTLDIMKHEIDHDPLVCFFGISINQLNNFLGFFIKTKQTNNNSKKQHINSGQKFNVKTAYMSVFSTFSLDALVSM